MANVVPPVRILSKDEICSLISNEDALDAVEVAYVSLANDPERTGKNCYGPANGMINFGDPRKEFHIKGAGNQGNGVFVIKMASAFYDNPTKYDGLPSGNGMVLVFDADKGFPVAVLQDGGHLTDLRTGAAAAVMAAKLQLPGPLPIDIGIIGNGIMANLVIDMYIALIGHNKYPARKVSTIRIWARNSAKAAQFAQDVLSKYKHINVSVEASANEVAAKSECIFTCTASREPLLTQKLRQGSVVVALGSDQPGKRELGDEIINDENTFFVCDDIHHCFEAGESEFLSDEKKKSKNEGRMCYSGEALEGLDKIREKEWAFVCDHTGVGTQDAAIADKLWQKVCAAEGKN